MKKFVYFFMGLLLVVAFTGCVDRDGTDGFARLDTSTTGTVATEQSSVTNVSVTQSQNKTHESHSFGDISNTSSSTKNQMTSEERYPQSSASTTVSSGTQSVTSVQLTEEFRLKQGEYEFKETWCELYGHITIKENNTFTLRANFDLDACVLVPPYTVSGTFSYTDFDEPMDEHGWGGKGTFVNFDINGTVLPFWVGSDGTAFWNQMSQYNLK